MLARFWMRLLLAGRSDAPHRDMPRTHGSRSSRNVHVKRIEVDVGDWVSS